MDELIDKLALGKAANTIIGDAKRRGISGGERSGLRLGASCSPTRSSSSSMNPPVASTPSPRSRWSTRSSSSPAATAQQ